MFWLDYGYNSGEGRKRIEKLCEDPDTTLMDVLSDPDFNHEARTCNGKLVTYLTSEKVLREMFRAVLSPRPGEKKTEGVDTSKNLYKKTTQCTDAICQTASHIFHAMKKYPDLVDELLNFLDAPEMNHLLVTFSIKIIANFLNQEPEEFIPMLETSEFLKKCWKSLHYSAIFELLCTMISCLPDFSCRERVKQWFVRERFVDALLVALSKDSRPEYHENASSIWQEFVQSLREMQINVEVTEDPLLNSLQGRESVIKLLDQMFPVDVTSYSPSIIANGAAVLNVLLETNYLKGCPSQVLAQDSPDGRGPAVDLTLTTPDVTIDPDRVVEMCVADYSAQLVRSLLSAAYASPDDHCGDVLARCAQMLVHLVNTNHFPTHLRLLATLQCQESSVEKLCKAFLFNPTCSIYASNLDNFITYVLYSEMTDGSPSPIAKHFFSEDVNLPRIVRTAFENVDKLKPLIKKVSMRGWLMRISQRIVRCQQIKPELQELAKALSDSAAWDQFVSSTVHAFAEMNRPQRTPSRTRSSTIIEVDELKDGTGSLVVEQVGGRVAERVSVAGIFKSATEKPVLAIAGEIASATINDAAHTAIDETPPAAMDEAAPATIDDTPPAAMDEAPLATMDEAQPTAIDEIPAAAMDEAAPATIDDTPPAAMDEIPAATMDEAQPTAIDEIAPTTINDAQPTAIDEAAPTTINEAPPAAVVDEIAPTTITEAAPTTINEAPPAAAAAVDETPPAIETAPTDGKKTGEEGVKKATED